MNRREFLFFKTDGSRKIAELSCEKLFVHYQGLSSGFHQAQEEAGSFDEADWWAGEPPLFIASIDTEAFFRSVQSEINDVDSLQVLDMEWLQQGDFRIRVETLLAAVRAKGSDVIFQTEEQVT